jgi:hypothetical protein
LSCHRPNVPVLRPSSLSPGRGTKPSRSALLRH